MIGGIEISENGSGSVDLTKIKKNYLIYLIRFEIAYALVLAFLANIVLKEPIFPRPNNMLYLSIVVSVAFFTLYLIENNYFILGVLFNFFLLWLIITILAISHEGFLTPGFPFLFFLVYLAYLILGKNYGNGFAVLVAFSFIVVTLNMHYHWFHRSLTSFGLIMEFSSYIFSLLAIILLAKQSLTILERSTKLAHERGEVNEELRHELEVAQEQINQAQKMDAIARMAGGLSHDFNNLLTAIIGNIELSLHEDSIGEIYQNLLLMKGAAEKASVLSRELLTFSRHRILEPRNCNINDLLEKNKSFVRSIVRKDIKIRYNLTRNINNSYLDIEKFEQAFYNLLLNATEAIRGHGEITITTYNKAVLSNNTDIPNYTCLSIRDTGKGINDEDLNHIFEPFFTTKETGTGIGLSTVYAFVVQSEGRIKVNSKVGKGTDVLMMFPSIEGEIISPSLKPLKSNGNSTRKNGSSYKILIVDDEEMIVNAFKKYLTMKKFEVKCFYSPIIALEYIKKNDGFDLVITDQVMPEMNGFELISEISSLYPSMKFIVISGFINDLNGIKNLKPELLENNQIDFVQKPFEFKFILRKIIEFLDKPVEQ